MAEKQENKQLEQNQHEKPMSFMTMVILTGLFGGIFFSALGYFSYVFNFTTISPNVILEPWAIGDWKKGVLGTVISIVLIGLISIGVALIYYVTLRKIDKIWVGMLFGLALYAMVFFVLNPIFPGIKSFVKTDMNTLITTGCLYILYGVFIGYSISYEEKELKMLEKKEVAH